MEQLLRLLQPRREDAAKLLLRVTLAGLTLFHGVDKVMNGLGDVRRDLVNAHMPAVMAYGVYVGELFAPIAILIGVWTRPAAAVLAGSILFATMIAHAHDYVSLAPTGAYAAESFAFYVLVGGVVALIGAGRYSMRGGRGSWD